MDNSGIGGMLEVFCHNFRTIATSVTKLGRVAVKNLGRLWLAYTELQGDFYMLIGHISCSVAQIKERNPYQYYVRMWACSDASSY